MGTCFCSIVYCFSLLPFNLCRRERRGGAAVAATAGAEANADEGIILRFFLHTKGTCRSALVLFWCMYIDMYLLHLFILFLASQHIFVFECTNGAHGCFVSDAAFSHFFFSDSVAVVAEYWTSSVQCSCSFFARDESTMSHPAV